MMEKKYYKRLDIIRVISCIAVLFYHLNILKGGYLAVCTFFVLTGFLSCNSAFKNDKFNIKKYYINRFIHIYLPLLIVVSLSVLVVYLIPTINWVSLKPETTSVLLGYNNFWQITANMDYFARHVSSPFMHLWYIGILLQFELVFPIIFTIFNNIKKKSKKSSVIILSLITILTTVIFILQSIFDTNIMNVYYNTFTRIFSILFGITLSFIITSYKNLIPIKNKAFNKIIFYLYILILIILFIFIDSKSNLFVIMMILTTFISCRLIDYATYESNTNLNIIDKITKYISSISYEVYLFQYPVIFIFQYIILKDYLKLPLIIIITIILSMIIHYAFSKKKNIFKILLMIIILGISSIGFYKYIITKDNTKEMNMLKEQLAKNEEAIKIKQEEYLKKLKEEQDNYKKALEEIELGETNLDQYITNLHITAIGDSVMLGAVPKLDEKFPNGYFDARVNRTDFEATRLLTSFRDQGLLGEPIIIHLGTNGQCGNRCRNDMMTVIGDKKVFWVTVTNDSDVHVNAGLKEYASEHGHYIIDWYNESMGHDEYFYKDKIHLNPTGQRAYTDVVYNKLYEVYKEDIKRQKEKMENEHNNLLKEKVSFYGNDLLLNAFPYMSEDFKEADFVIDNEFTFNKLIKRIEKDKKEEKLSYNVVFVFDNSFRLSKKEFNDIKKLLDNNKIYIVSINNNFNIKDKDTKVIHFNSKDYFMADRLHLTDEGNKALNKLLLKEIKNKE